MVDPPRAREVPALGLVLRRHRTRAGLTQEMLAERAGLGTRTIQGFERGERRPHRGTVERLADALGLDGAQRAEFEAAARPLPRPEAPPAARRGPRLPLPLTTFVGREREIGEVERRLASTRLVTLTGPPGVGKTRLALEVAARLADAFEGGVRLVRLAAVRDPELVVPAIAAGLGVEGRPGQSLLDRVAEALGRRSCLFVLDNFEQVAAAAPRLAELLEACPRLAALVTSRARLRLRGECEVVLQGLSLPQELADPAADRSEAVRLFLARAREAGHDLEASRENLAAVAAICRRVDGLPLAIELAAAWCKLLAPPALLARLSQRLALLRGGAADLPARQQTLRAAIDWSHALLSPAERALLRRLAVFDGGFAADAAEAVTDATLETLAALVDKSLLRADPADGAPRFRLLETIRDYASDQLAARGEVEALRRRHAAHFLALAETAKVGFESGQEKLWLDRLEREHDNLRAALRFLIDAGEAEPALRLADAMQWLWATRCSVEEVRQWVGELLDLATTAGREADRSRVLRTAGRLAFIQSNYTAARAQMEEGLAIARRLGDRRGAAEALAILGLTALARGDYAAGGSLAAESLELFRELGDDWGAAAQLDRVGTSAFYQGDVDTARSFFIESLEVRRRIGDPVYLAWVPMLIAQVDHAQGDLAGARAHYEECLTTWREHDYRHGLGEALPGLGALALDEGDLASARALLLEGLEICIGFGSWWGVVLVLECLVGLAAARGSPARALRLAGAAAGLRDALGDVCPPDVGARLARWTRRARELMGEPAAAAAWAEGGAMTLEQAIAFARAGEADPPTTAAPLPAPTLRAPRTHPRG